MSEYEGPDRRRRWPSWQNVAVVLALGLAAWSTLGVSSRSREVEGLARENSQRISEIAGLTHRIKREANERRDQTCRVLEGQHLTNVERLKATYHYLGTLPREDYGKPLTLAVLRGLRTQEAEAREDQAPPFCDEPGVKAERAGAKPVGLPEPDPVLPKRRDFSALAHQP